MKEHSDKTFTVTAYLPDAGELLCRDEVGVECRFDPFVSCLLPQDSATALVGKTIHTPDAWLSYFGMTKCWLCNSLRVSQ